MSQRLDAPKHIVTFVHGTWAPNTRWARKGSQLYDLLSTQLGDASIKLFQWTGKNSHKDRLQAGRDLATILKDRIKDYPNSKHFIIAHSHGGNVVLYALRDLKLRKSIAGLLFMGTPFIFCKPRNILESFGVFPLALGVILSAFCIIPLYLASLLSQRYSNRVSWL